MEREASADRAYSPDTVQNNSELAAVLESRVHALDTKLSSGSFWAVQNTSIDHHLAPLHALQLFEEMWYIATGEIYA